MPVPPLTDENLSPYCSPIALTRWSTALSKSINARAGLNFAQVHIKAEDLPRALPSRDGMYIKNRFRQSLALPTF